ncbi:MAG: T9SS type A sorting domain-containing protein, partial [Fibrobacteres bacterium]|nr:T9SS type A sorting domain-containing protein [Fibrobacterota bacterium]
NNTTLMNGEKLPKNGNILKVDITNNDDDLPGGNGHDSNSHSANRRRGGWCGNEPTHWSDTKYFMAFKYAGENNGKKVVDIATGCCSRVSCYPPIGNLVDSLTGNIRYDFLRYGVIKINNIAYYYDSISSSDGYVNFLLTKVAEAISAGMLKFQRHPTNPYLDKAILQMVGQPPINLIRPLVAGNEQLSNTRWVKARMEISNACPDGLADTILSPLRGADGGREFRFIALSQLVDSLVPAPYKNCADSLRIYITGTDSIVDVLTYTDKPAQLIHSKESTPLASYRITKLTGSRNANSPTAMILTYSNGKKDTLLKVECLDLKVFGETAPVYNGYQGGSTNEHIKLYPVDKLDIAWRIMVEKYTTFNLASAISINDRYYARTDSGTRCRITFGKVYKPLAYYPATFNGPVYRGTIASFSTYDPSLETNLFEYDISTDSVILEGYTGNPLSPGAVTRRWKHPDSLTPDNAWIEQTVTFKLHYDTLSDTYIFKDTTKVYHWPYVNGLPFTSDGIPKANTIDSSSRYRCPRIAAEDNLQQTKHLQVNVFPNPFNPSTVISASIPSIHSEQSMNLNIYDVRGQLVRTLYKGNVTRGGFVKKLIWEGENNSGCRVSSGLYFYRLVVGNKVIKGSLVMVK